MADAPAPQPQRKKVSYTPTEKAAILNLKNTLAQPDIDPSAAYKATLAIQNMRQDARERADARWESRQKQAKGVAAKALAARARSRRSPEESERVEQFLAFLRAA